MKLKTLQILQLICWLTVITNAFGDDIPFHHGDVPMGSGSPHMNQHNNVGPGFSFGPEPFDQSFFAHNNHHQDPPQSLGNSMFHESNFQQPGTKFNNVKQSNRSPPVQRVQNAPTVNSHRQNKNENTNSKNAQMRNSNAYQNKGQKSFHQTGNAPQKSKVSNQQVKQRQQPVNSPPKRGPRYGTEYKNLQSFKSKVHTFKSGDECVNGCEVEVCRKSTSGDINYCIEKICRERICSRHYDRKCQDAMSRRNEYSTISMTGCINVCGCDAIESKFEGEGVKQTSSSANQMLPSNKQSSGNGQSTTTNTQYVVSHWIPSEDESPQPNDEDTKFIGLMDELNSEWRYNSPQKEAHDPGTQSQNAQPAVDQPRIDPSVDSTDGEDGPSAIQSEALHGQDDTKTMQFSSSSVDEFDQMKEQEKSGQDEGGEAQSGVIQSADLHEEVSSDEGEDSKTSEISEGSEISEMDEDEDDDEKVPNFEQISHDDAPEDLSSHEEEKVEDAAPTSMEQEENVDERQIDEVAGGEEEKLQDEALVEQEVDSADNRDFHEIDDESTTAAGGSGLGSVFWLPSFNLFGSSDVTTSAEQEEHVTERPIEDEIGSEEEKVQDPTSMEQKEDVNERQIEEVVGSEGDGNTDYDEDAMKKLMGEIHDEEGANESPVEEESEDEDDSNFTLDDEHQQSSKNQRKKSKAELMGESNAVGKASAIEPVSDDYEEDDLADDLYDDDFQLDEDVDSADDRDVHVIDDESTTAAGGSGLGGVFWNLFGPSDATEEPIDPNIRIVRTDPQSGPVDQEKAERQSKYAAPTHGRVSSHYYNDIKPERVPKPPPTTTATPLLAPSTSEPTERAIELQTVTELPPEQMGAFVAIIKKVMERGGSDPEEFRRIEKDNDISLSTEIRKEIKRKALNAKNDDTSKFDSQDSEEKSGTRKKKKERVEKKDSDDEMVMAMADGPKSHGSPEETVDVDLDYQDDDQDEKSDPNTQNDVSNILNQDQQEAHTKIEDDEKAVIAEESSSKSEWDVLDTAVFEYVMTDAENDSQSFKIDTSLPVLDMSEILLAHANSLSSHTALFNVNGQDNLDDILNEVDDPHSLQASPTHAPQAQFTAFTESFETTTESAPFVSGVTEEAETVLPTESTEEVTKIPESDLQEVHDALNDDVKSELDDPVDAVTEAESVAAYYQGETTTPVEEVTDDMESVEEKMKLEMAAGDSDHAAPVEPESADSGATSNEANEGKEEGNAPNEEGQNAHTTANEEEKPDAKETKGDWDWSVILGGDYGMDNILTDARDANNSFIIETSLPVPDISEILLPDATSLGTYSVLFTHSENEQLIELLKTVDESNEFAEVTSTEYPNMEVTPEMELEMTEDITTTEQGDPFVTGQVLIEENSFPVENSETGTKTSEEDLADISFSLDSPDMKSDLDDPDEARTEGESAASFYQGDTSTISFEMGSTPSESGDGEVKNVESEQIDPLNQEGQEGNTIVKTDFSEASAQEPTNHHDEERPFMKETSNVEYVFTDAGNDNETFIIDTSLPVQDVSELLLGDASSLSSYAQIFDSKEGDDELTDILRTADDSSDLTDEVTDSPEPELTVYTDSPDISTSKENDPFVTGSTMDDGEDAVPAKPAEKPTDDEELQKIEDTVDEQVNVGTELDDPVDAETEAMSVAEYYQGETTQATSTAREVLPTAYAGLREDDEDWIDDDDNMPTRSSMVEQSSKSDDYEWDLFEDEKVTEPASTQATPTEPPPTQPPRREQSATKPPQQDQPKPRSPQTEETRDPVPKPDPQYSTPQVDNGKSKAEPGPPPETPPEEKKKSKPPPQVPRERRKTHMPSEDEEEGSFWDEKPKQTNKKNPPTTRKPQKASGRKKRENEEMNAPAATAPTAEAPNPDEGVVPDEDGGIFSDDSMISKPPKAMTKKSGSEKLEDMFDDGVRSEDHQQNEQHYSDSSSKKLNDQTYGELGDGSKWYKSTNGTSKANAEVSQEDKKDTEDVEATGEDSQGRTNYFQSHKNVRERNKKLSSSSSSHTSSTTKIKGGKKKKNKKGGNKSNSELVSDAEVTPTTTTESSVESTSQQDATTSTTSPVKREKREVPDSENPIKSPPPVQHSNARYSYCNVDFIGTKYEAFKCRKDCYAKCSPAESREDQCLDACFLMKCTLEDPGDDRDNCEAMCQKSCDSESTLQDLAKGPNKKSQVSRDECDDHVTQLLYFYGEFRDEMMNEYCNNLKSRRK